MLRTALSYRFDPAKALRLWKCALVGVVSSYPLLILAPALDQDGLCRVLGGILVPAVILIVVKWRSAHAHGGVFEEKTRQVSREKWRRIWPWVLANALAGQTLGVTCMQWALATTSAGIVTAINATTPIFQLPMTRIVDGEKIGRRSLIGALVAVGGVIGLTFFR